MSILFILLTLILSSCEGSKIIYDSGKIDFEGRLKDTDQSGEVESNDNNNSSSPLEQNNADPSNYTISAPSKLFANARDTISFTLNRISGTDNLNISKLGINGLASASCSNIEAENVETDNPIIHISNCSGEGFISLSYGETQSAQIPLNAIFENHLRTIRSVKFNEDESIAYLLDIDVNSIYALDMSTGSLSLISRQGVHSGPDITYANYMTYSNNKLFLSHDTSDSIIEVNINTGVRSVVSDASNGSGTNFDRLKAIAVSADGSTGYALDDGLNAIFEVNMATGDRVIISNADNGSPWNEPLDIIISPSNSNLAYVVDNGSDAVYSVDLSSGSRTLISRSGSRGDGLSLVGISRIQLSADEQTIYVSDNYRKAIFAIEISTGDREVIAGSTNDIGSGFKIHGIGDIAASSDGERLYYSNYANTGIYYIDLNTQNRNILYNSIVGSGAPIHDPFQFTISNSNDEIYVSDDDSRNVVRVNIASGERSVAVHESLGTGPEPVNPRGVCFSSDSNIGYLAEAYNNLIMSFNLETGNREIVSDNVTVGSGTSIDYIYELLCPNSVTELYYNDISLDEFYRVNITTGDRSLLSGSIHSGLSISYARNLQLNSLEDSIYYTDASHSALMKVDIASGNRSLISGGPSGGTGSGPSIGYASGLAIKSDESKAYFINNSAVYEIDISTGDRSEIASATMGSGPDLRGTFKGLILNEDETLLYSVLGSGIIEINIATGDRIFISR